MIRASRLIAAAALATTLWSAPVAGHETDQYTLPIDRPFADLADYLDATHFHTLDRAVKILNAEIDAALTEEDPSARAAALARIHNPGHVADVVYSAFNDAFFEIVDIELALRSDWAARMYPGKITAHWTADWLYTYTHFPLDPRRVVLLFQSSTIKAYGVYFGTDKLSHFHHLGHMYFESYRARLASGATEDEAVRGAVKEFTDGPISESGLIGFIATGVHSNGDLVANYTGMKFFRNLTEPVMLKGEMRPPLLVRKGPHFRLNQHVRPESGWFGAFVSDHWNEALNPSLYDYGVDANVQWLLKKRADSIVRFYVEVDGRPRDPVYFDDLARELSMYYGEEYGHAGSSGELLTLGNTCIPESDRLRRERELLARANSPRPAPVFAGAIGAYPVGSYARIIPGEAPSP